MGVGGGYWERGKGREARVYILRVCVWGGGDNSDSKTLILKDSSVRSIWTYLTYISIHILNPDYSAGCCCMVFVDSEMGNVQLMKRLSHGASPTG